MLRQRHALAHADDAHVVDHLRHDHDVVRGLHDRVIVVVEVVREHRRAGVGPERHEAAQGEPEILRMVVIAELAVELSALGTPLLSLGRQRGNPAVGGVGDDRASRLVVVDGHPVAPIDIDVVVGSRSNVEHVSVELPATYRRRPAVGIAGRGGVLDEVLAPPLDRHDLVPRQYRALSSRALHRGDRRVAPVPLEVRTTVGRTGQHPLLLAGGGRLGRRGRMGHRTRVRHGALPGRRGRRGQ